VGDSWSHVHDTFEGNVLTTQRLFESVRKLGLKPRVLVTGSAMIYKPIDRLITENDALASTSPYATSKLAQEMLSERAWTDDGIPVLIARAFNHVGPRQAPAFVAPSIARQIALIEAGRMPPVLSVGNLAPKRELTDVRDTACAYRSMMASAKPGIPYNVCTGKPFSIQHLLDLFLSRARVPIRIEQDPAKFRANDHPLLAGDGGRLKRDTGWEPKIPLEQTVDDLLTYWRKSVAGDG
jgi:GDP-4-dehydro-6-deoxy-D-mannose reductase